MTNEQLVQEMLLADVTLFVGHLTQSADIPDWAFRLNYLLGLAAAKITEQDKAINNLQAELDSAKIQLKAWATC